MLGRAFVSAVQRAGENRLSTRGPSSCVLWGEKGCFANGARRIGKEEHRTPAGAGVNIEHRISNPAVAGVVHKIYTRIYVIRWDELGTSSAHARFYFNWTRLDSVGRRIWTIRNQRLAFAFKIERDGWSAVFSSCFSPPHQPSYITNGVAKKTLR